MSEPRDPRTHAEWQEAADAAAFMLLLDSAKLYGLIEGGPEINSERCSELLDEAKRRGYRPAGRLVDLCIRPQRGTL